MNEACLCARACMCKWGGVRGMGWHVEWCAYLSGVHTTDVLVVMLLWCAYVEWCAYESGALKRVVCIRLVVRILEWCAYESGAYT